MPHKKHQNHPPSKDQFHGVIEKLPAKWVLNPAERYQLATTPEAVRLALDGPARSMRCTAKLPGPLDLSRMPFTAVRYRVKGRLDSSDYLVALDTANSNRHPRTIFALRPGDIISDGQWPVFAAALESADPVGRCRMNTITGSYLLALAFSAVTANPENEWLSNVSAKLPAEEAALVRRAQATLLGNVVVAKAWVPRRGIVPSTGTYHGVWNWDAAFHAVGVSHWDATLAREQVEIILSGQQPNGMLPDVLYENGRVVVSVTKPPVMAWAVAIIDRRDPDDAWLREVYPRLVKNTEFWLAERGGRKDGLFYEYYDSRTGAGLGTRNFGWSATFTLAFILDWDNDNLTWFFPPVPKQ
jgi:hypothetical protein